MDAQQLAEQLQKEGINVQLRASGGAGGRKASGRGGSSGRGGGSSGRGSGAAGGRGKASGSRASGGRAGSGRGKK